MVAGDGSSRPSLPSMCTGHGRRRRCRSSDDLVGAEAVACLPLGALLAIQPRRAGHPKDRITMPFTGELGTT